MAETDFEVFDESFRRRIRTSAGLEQLASNNRWTEGPVYFPVLRTLVWSDIPNNRLMSWDEANNKVSTLRQPAEYTNGNTIDRQGRLVSCRQGSRCIVRYEHDGQITTIANNFSGKRFNSPNDLVVKSDGSIWFTDPSYGIDSYYEGLKAQSEIGSCNVYRVDSHSGITELVADDFVQPNGLAFSPDEKQLFIVDSGATHGKDLPRHIRVFDIDNSTKKLKQGKIFAECTAGLFDGMRFDEEGYLWTSAANGVHCYSPAGDLLGIVKTPERVSNLCFGGAKRNRLFICATSSIYSMLLPVRGTKTF